MTDNRVCIYILRRCQIYLHAFPAHHVPSTLSFLLSPNLPFIVLSLCQRLLLGPSALAPHWVHTVGFLYTQVTKCQKWWWGRIEARSPFVQGNLREFPGWWELPISRLMGCLCSIIFFFNVYLFLGQRETEHERGRGRERGRHRIGSRLQLWAISPEPDAGLEFTDREIVTWLKSDA